jgi:hypothetical protein
MTVWNPRSGVSGAERMMGRLSLQVDEFAREQSWGRWALTVVSGLDCRPPVWVPRENGPIHTSAPADELAQCNFNSTRKGGTFPSRSLVLLLCREIPASLHPHDESDFITPVTD